jgi:membrane associated rhomboid family serine protease
MKYAAISLVAINVAIFAVQIAVPSVTEDFALVASDIPERPWILVTSMFLHGSATHILGNMFALGLFGLLLESLAGPRKFLAIYFASGLVSGLLGSLFYESAIGASGAIFGVMGTLAALRPKMTVWTYGVPMPMAVAAGFWLLLDIVGVFYPSSVANIAHIAGLLFGAAVGILLRNSYPESRPRKYKRSVSDEELDKWEEKWM